MMKKIAIIDDNRSVRDALKNIISHNFKKVFEIKEANGVLAGHQLIEEFNPDIVLLDIEMGDGTGLDLVNLFTEINFKLVFITAHKEYAIQAIKHRPYGYLLKPINPFDLIKLLKQIQEELVEPKAAVAVKDKIVIKNQDSSVLIDKQDIIRCEADGSYTKIITKEGEFLASKNLKYYCEMLADSNFLRVHHAHFVNTEFIKSFERHLQSGITLKNGDKIPVSSRKVKEILEFLDSLN